MARETGRFLAGITDRLAAHGTDAVAGLTAAVEGTLREGPTTRWSRPS